VSPQPIKHQVASTRGSAASGKTDSMNPSFTQNPLEKRTTMRGIAHRVPIHV
jgi:hypothetical protein